MELTKISHRQIWKSISLISVTIVMISLIMTGCNGNLKSEKTQKDVYIESVDSIPQSVTKPTVVAEKPKELTKETRELFDLLALGIGKTEIERKILVKRYQDSLQQIKNNERKKLRAEYTKKYGKKYTDEVFEEMEREEREEKQLQEDLINHYKKLYGDDYYSYYLQHLKRLDEAGYRKYKMY